MSLPIHLYQDTVAPEGRWMKLASSTGQRAWCPFSKIQACQRSEKPHVQ